MNKQLEDFARSTLKEGLAQCTDEQQDFFMRMYGRTTIAPGLDTLEDVVDNMPVEQLDWAMQQVQRTIADNK